MGSPTLREALTYEPVELRFGTSGRRGEVIHLTQLEVYVNVVAEVEYLLSLPRDRGGIERYSEFFIGHDLRPSSTQLMPEFAGRGEILQAVFQAVDDCMMRPACLGPVPTPAVMRQAVSRGNGSIMVTGSHIPFDRNGYKTNSSRGELRKEDEAPILVRVADVRQRLYTQPFEESLFDTRGMFKDGHRDLPRVFDIGAKQYIDRYRSFFPSGALQGLRVLVYQHSAVGRDLLVEMLSGLGADAVPAGRSETFVPIDTENVEEATLREIEKLAEEAGGRFDAVVSTDGDSDRPLIVGLEDGRARFFGGDLVGMVTAEYLGADAVVVPISCNDAIERGALGHRLEPQTRIGSPFVIAGMERAVAEGKRAVCGWEANGGFLVGSDITRDGRRLDALPTRDAFLPILCCLHAMKENQTTLAGLFDALPRRFSRAALLRGIPRETGLAIAEMLGGKDETAKSGDGRPVTEVERERLASYFSTEMGFGRAVRLSSLDGVRIWFDNGDIAHVRPSGNADELRIYAVADTQERADAIMVMAVAEPDGILRKLEAAAA
jgi:phosphomannomutase